MKKPNAKRERASLAELRAMKGNHEIASPRAGAPTYDPPNGFWESAQPYAPSKKSVHLRVDQDVFDYFRAQGSGHLTRMNAVLASYVRAHRENANPSGSRTSPRAGQPGRKAKPQPRN